jgi:sensor histidine kinase YesM
MTWNKKKILNETRDVVLLGVVGLIMTWSGLTCRDCIDTPRKFWIIASFTSIMWIVLWKGNEHLGNYLTRRVSWLKNPGRKFLMYVIFTFVFTFGAMYSLGGIYYFLFEINLTVGAIYSVVITIIISLFMHGRSFLMSWKQTAIDAERFQRESMAAKYESLKNQVNPHFLFNSFNALTNLVYEDPDKAAKFIKQLSEVYRYVLDTREMEVVPIGQELKFLESYIYLQQIRFGSKLKVRISIEKTNFSIPPLSLQMLIENAIKHNVVSEDDPLNVEVYLEAEFVVVRNNLQEKSSLGEPSAGVGLENICRRYEFLTSTKVNIESSNGEFTVKLPLLAEIAI